MNKISMLTIVFATASFFAGAALATSESSTALKSSKKLTAPKGTINVLSATYGENCTKKSVKGNATNHIKFTCNGKTTCDYKVEVNNIGDPFFGCPKTYVVEYSCGDKTIKADLPAEASYQPNPLKLSCEKTTNTSTGEKVSTSESKSTSSSSSKQ